MLEGALPAGEGKAGMGAGEGRIKFDRVLEEALCQSVLILDEAIHVPKAAMICFPGIERTGRL
jgi:hypothetical protein